MLSELDKAAIRESIEMRRMEYMTPEERACAKDMQAARDTRAIYENIAKAKGKIEGKIETAKNLVNLGVSNEIIAKSTGLSLKEIEDLRNLN